MTPHERARDLLDGRDVTDDVQEALDEMVFDAMHGDASRLANQQVDDSRDEELHALADTSTSSINNLGPEGQIAWLIRQGFTEEDITARAFGSDNAPAPGM